MTRLTIALAVVAGFATTTAELTGYGPGDFVHWHVTAGERLASSERAIEQTTQTQKEIVDWKKGEEKKRIREDTQRQLEACVKACLRTGGSGCWEKCRGAQ